MKRAIKITLGMLVAHLCILGAASIVCWANLLVVHPAEWDAPFRALYLMAMGACCASLSQIMIPKGA